MYKITVLHGLKLTWYYDYMSIKLEEKSNQQIDCLLPLNMKWSLKYENGQFVNCTSI